LDLYEGFAYGIILAKREPFVYYTLDPHRGKKEFKGILTVYV